MWTKFCASYLALLVETIINLKGRDNISSKLFLNRTVRLKRGLKAKSMRESEVRSIEKDYNGFRTICKSFQTRH